MLVLQSSKKFSPAARIIRSEEYLANEEVQAVIADAKERRKKLLEQGELQIKMMQDNAKTELENAKTASMEAFQQECNVKQAEMILSMIAGGIKYFSSLQDTFVQTLKALFIKILDEYPPEERMYALVQNTIKTIPESRVLRISVHPDQLPLLKTKVKDLVALQPSLERVEAEANKTLKLDECILESETGVIEAGIMIQLDALIKAIENLVH